MPYTRWKSQFLISLPLTLLTKLYTNKLDVLTFPGSIQLTHSVKPPGPIIEMAFYKIVHSADLYEVVKLKALGLSPFDRIPGWTSPIMQSARTLLETVLNDWILISSLALWAAGSSVCFLSSLLAAFCDITVSLDTLEEMVIVAGPQMLRTGHNHSRLWLWSVLHLQS